MSLTVKPLVWRATHVPQFNTTYHTADVGLGRYYQVYSHPLVSYCQLWTEAKDMEDPPSGTVNGSTYPTLAAAQAAAASEWETFIRAAVEETPSP